VFLGYVTATRAFNRLDEGQARFPVPSSPIYARTVTRFNGRSNCTSVAL
jgi:hypothetical protein